MAGILLRTEPTVQVEEPAEDVAPLVAFDDAPAAAPPRRSWRWARPAIALACAAALAVAGLQGRHRLAHLWRGSDLQGKQFLAMPAPGQLAVTPDCTTGPLPALWTAEAGPDLRLNVLSYNLFWWSLFDKGQPGQLHFHQRTSGNGATRLIAQHTEQDPFDVMGFQECEDEQWLLSHAGLAGQYEIFRDRACCMAYRKASWTLLAKGVGYVAQDPKYGQRPAQWMRLKNIQTGAVVFFMNHHGPIPINSGGLCGAAATGYNMLQVIKANARQGDAVVVVGDFNANAASATIQELEKRLQKVVGGKVDGGIDYIFSNLGSDSVAGTKNLGSGGSDHEALSAVLQRGSPSAASAAAEAAASVAGPASEAVQSLLQHSPMDWLKK